MRYLIAILTVSAFALTAGTALAQCPDPDTLEVLHDYDLPDCGVSYTTGGSMDPGEDCDIADYEWRFYRTTKTDNPNTRVKLHIFGTTIVDGWIDSDYYPDTNPGFKYLYDSGDVLGNVQSGMCIDPENKVGGHFDTLRVITTLSESE